MKRAVFLDSGIFIAALDRSDRWHRDACGLFVASRAAWVTSFLVVSETYSWFLHRLGEEAARTFRSFLTDLPRLTLLDATTKHYQDVLRTLDAWRGIKLTYVDASSLAFLATHKIKVVWGTDHHLGLTGAQVLPVATL